ncbi:MAG: hypothetical protein JWO67_980 [Streptosporangiaceae bacterium]|nr:hypothetical protein [Streptosporangiaceae bacterium]
MLIFLVIAVLAGVPACVAYAGKGGERFRSIVGTIHLALAFIVACAAAAEMLADPPAPTAVATGLLSVVLAVTALALRPSSGGGTAHDGSQDRRGTAQAVPQPHSGQWATPPHPGMPPTPGAPPQPPWPPAGR